jgi:hypothetical protein
VSAQVEETKGGVSSNGVVNTDQNPEKKPYGYKQMKPEETKEFKSLSKLEKTIGTFADESKEDEALVDTETAK